MTTVKHYLMFIFKVIERAPKDIFYTHKNERKTQMTLCILTLIFIHSIDTCIQYNTTRMAEKTYSSIYRIYSQNNS